MLGQKSIPGLHPGIILPEHLDDAGPHVRALDRGSLHRDETLEIDDVLGAEEEEGCHTGRRRERLPERTRSRGTRAPGRAAARPRMRPRVGSYRAATERSEPTKRNDRAGRQWIAVVD